MASSAIFAGPTALAQNRETTSSSAVLSASASSSAPSRAPSAHQSGPPPVAAAPAAASPPVPQAPQMHALGSGVTTGSLYVGDLAPDVNEAVLTSLFEPLGRLSSVRVCREAGTRRSLGYGYVNYQDVQDATRALKRLNFSLIRGQPCRIMWCHRDPALRRAGTGNVFVKNLDKVIDEKGLYDAFSVFGPILSCKVKRDDFGKSRGFGFIHFENEEDGKKAIESVNGMLIGTKCVYVGPFKKRSERLQAAAGGAMSAHQGGNFRKSYTNLYVKHIPKEWTDEIFSQVFSPFGPITSQAFSTDARGRRFGFVNFEKPEDARAAVAQLHGKKTAPDGMAEQGESVEEKVPAATADPEKASEKNEEQEALLTSEKKANVDKNDKEHVAAADEVAKTKCDTEEHQVADTSSIKSGVGSVSSEEIEQTLEREGPATAKDVASSEASAQKAPAAPDTTVVPEAANPAQSTDASAEKKDSQSQVLSAMTSEAAVSAILDDISPDCLYVQPAMSKRDRINYLRSAFANSAGPPSVVSGKPSVASASVQAAPPAASVSAGSNLYVKNFDSGVTDENLRELFSEFGRITSAKVMLDHGGASRGFGFVCFARPEDASVAQQAMHLRVFHNKPLYVGLAERKEQRVHRLENRYRQSHHRGAMAAGPPMHGGSWMAFPHGHQNPMTAPTAAVIASHHQQPLFGGSPPMPSHHPLSLSQMSPFPTALAAHQSHMLPPPHHLMSQNPTLAAAAAAGMLGSGGPTSVLMQQPMNAGLPPPNQAQHFHQLPPPQGGAAPMFFGPPLTGGQREGGPPFPNQAAVWRQQQDFLTGGQPRYGPQAPNYPYQVTASPNGLPPTARGVGRDMGGAGSAGFKFTAQARNRGPDFPSIGAAGSMIQDGVGGPGVRPMQPPQMPSLQAGSMGGVQQAVTRGLLMGGFESMPLSAQALAAAHPQMQKQMLGERLFPLVAKRQPELAGKITGMMLEMDNAELLSLLESEEQLITKIEEALGVLHRHNQAARSAHAKSPAAPSQPPSAMLPRPKVAEQSAPFSSEADQKRTASTSSTSAAPVGMAAPQIAPASANAP